MAKPLPPTHRPGTSSLLGASEEHPLDPEWRADALGRSRHSRLASEVREPLADPDPQRAEKLCAEVTRKVLGDLAPALMLLSAARRRRTRALTAWTVALFDFALRPGLAGLDGDRLAQINAWEFRTEEALDGNPAGQPIFVAIARENAATPWPREALDEIVTIARRAALASKSPMEAGNTVWSRSRAGADPSDALELGRAALTALFDAESATALAPLVCVAILEEQIPPHMVAPAACVQGIEAVRVAAAPPGWRRAASYVQRALRARLRRTSSGGQLGPATRLRILAVSFF